MIPNLNGEDLAQWLEQIQAEIFAAELMVGLCEDGDL